MADSLYAEALALLDQLARQTPDNAISLRVLFRMRQIYALADQFEGFAAQLNKYHDKLPETFIGKLAYRLSVPSLLRIGRAQEALTRANDLLSVYEKDDSRQDETAWLLFDRVMIQRYMNKRGLSKSNAGPQQDLNAIVNQYAETGAAEHVRRLFKLNQEKAPEIAEKSLPEKFTVYCNYPNPFNPETRISYDVPKAEQVVIDIV
ncbi:MAG: hypothetical protein U5R06_16420 [candidate division KSB1 bacterium]|nr:hypothetical protein [candidate division KSB1 bacterium]